MADSNVHPHLRLDVDLAGQDMDIDHLVIDTGDIDDNRMQSC